MRALRALRARPGGAMPRQPERACWPARRYPDAGRAACHAFFGEHRMALFFSLVGSLILVLASTWWTLRR